MRTFPGHYVEVVIVTLHEGRLCALTSAPGTPPFEGEWTPPAERTEADDDDPEVARRILLDRIGLYVPNLQLGGFQSSRNGTPGPFLIFCGYAPVDRINALIHERQEYRIEELRSVCTRMGYSALILTDRIRSASMLIEKEINSVNKRQLTDFFSLISDEFSLSDFQGAIEGIRGVTLDKRNFRRDILASGLLEDTGHVRRGRNRPATLYKLSSRFFAQAED